LFSPLFRCINNIFRVIVDNISSGTNLGYSLILLCKV